MNWDALGAIGELIGALAVVLTLGYLAIQVRQNNLAGKVAAKQEMTRQYSDYVDLLLMNPKLFELNNRVIRDNGECKSEIEEAQVMALLNKATWYFSSMHFQFASHSLSEDEWQQSKTLISRYCDYPRFKTFWEQNKVDYSSGFQAFIEDH